MMLGPTTPKTDVLRYAVDNGAYPCFVKGEEWDELAFRRLVAKCYQFNRKPDFAVCPDIVAGGLNSLAFSLSWICDLPEDWPWYLAVQDGMTEADVAPVLDRFSGLFVGGSTDWKMRTMPEWTKIGHRAGMKVHAGRVNTPPRVFFAVKVCGVDSFDGNNWNRTWDYAKPLDVVNDRQLPLGLWS